jgi:protein arginine N-methyltransferase 1
MTSDDLQFHAWCLTQTGTRLDQFAKAIAGRVKPGDAVVDLGAGSGILAFLACMAGARRVYAIEAGESLSLARRLAASSAFHDRIEFINTSSTQAVLPERIDVIVADIHDTFGLQPDGVAAFIDARDRFLKPGGSLIPSSIRLFAAPIEAGDLYRKTIDVWQLRVHSVDLSPLRALAVNVQNAGRFEREQLLATPAALGTIDLTHTNTPHVAGTIVTRATRDGTMHGVCGCFVTTLSDGVTMSNVPGESSTTNFAQAFFPLESPLTIRTGDEIMIRVETHDGAAARWQVVVAREGRPLACFDHSTLKSESLRLESLRKQADDYRPTLTARGEMERALLDAFDGTRTAAQLEAWLRERFGDVLPSTREAAAVLKSMIERCG